MLLKDTDRTANSEGPDQTEAVWYGSALFVQTCLSYNSGVCLLFLWGGGFVVDFLGGGG